MNYTFQYGDAGQFINSDTELPFVDLTKITGFDSGEFRTSNRVREGVDGGFLDAEYENMRTIVLEGNAYADPGNIIPYLFQLKADYSPTKKAKPLYFELPGLGPMVLYCKSLGIKFDIEQAVATGVTPVQIQLQAEDPTIYARDLKIVTAVFDTTAPTLGRGYNRSYSYGYGASGQVAPGTLIIRNSGFKEAKALIRISNTDSPQIISDNEGKVISLKSYISGTDYMELDLRNRTVMLNGTTNRGNQMVTPTSWFMIQPGDNYLRLLGKPAGLGKPTMTVILQDAYR